MASAYQLPIKHQRPSSSLPIREVDDVEAVDNVGARNPSAARILAIRIRTMRLSLSVHFLWISAFLCLANTASAFVKGTARGRPHRLELQAVAKGGAKKKASSKSAAAAKQVKEAKASVKEPVENFKKVDFIASVAERTGMTKASAEEALNAVIDTITDVSQCIALNINDGRSKSKLTRSYVPHSFFLFSRMSPLEKG